MNPAHWSYAACRMKSAESSAGLAPLTFITHDGALSMMAAMAVLPQVAPALRARGPLHRCSDDGEHEQKRDREGQHHGPTLSASGGRPSPRWATSAVSTRVPS